MQHTYTQMRLHYSTVYFISYRSNTLRHIQSYIQCKHTHIQVLIYYIVFHADIHILHTYTSIHSYIAYISHHTYIHAREVHNITLCSATILSYVHAYMPYIHTYITSLYISFILIRTWMHAYIHPMQSLIHHIRTYSFLNYTIHSTHTKFR